jgi:hypothetical protein
LAFFSRQLHKAEKNYATIDRELLGIHEATLHFRYFLEGRKFTVFTDHRPIVAAIKKKSELKSGRQSRQLATISEFTTDIQHVAGKENVVADALSRSPIPYQINAIQPGPTLNAMTRTLRAIGQPSPIFSSKTSLLMEEVSLFCVMCLLAWLDPWSRNSGVGEFLIQCIHCLIQVLVPQRRSSPPNSFGMVLANRLPSGLGHAFNVNGPKYTNTPKPHSPNSSPPNVVSATFTLTWWGLFLNR